MSLKPKEYVMDASIVKDEALSDEDIDNEYLQNLNFDYDSNTFPEQVIIFSDLS